MQFWLFIILALFVGMELGEMLDDYESSITPIADAESYKVGDRITCSFPFVPYSGTSGQVVSHAYHTEFEFVIEDVETFLADSELRGDDDLCAFAKALLLGGSITHQVGGGDPAWNWCSSVGDLAHGVRCASAKTSPAEGIQQEGFMKKEEEGASPNVPPPSKPRGRVKVIMATALA